jgi:hypothetical protein
MAIKVLIKIKGHHFCDVLFKYQAVIKILSFYFIGLIVI